jgi:hypothetical protein
MRHRDTSGQPSRARRALGLAVAGLLVIAGVAFAAGGLVNPSFEDGLNGWTAETVRGGVYEPASCTASSRRAICVIEGTDTFTPAGGSPVTVEPRDGNRMVRLGGPFTSAAQVQARERYVLRQTFTVDPENPVLVLNYNVFLFDYQGFDRLNFTVRLTDRDGDPITGFTQGGFGGGTSLKTTGWRSAVVDLSGFEGQQVHLVIDSGGTQDRLYGFWAYVDAGEAIVPPVSPPDFEVPINPSTNEPVPVNTYTDPASGQVFIAIPSAQADDFPSGCVGPIPISVPIEAGGGTVSDVFLVGAGAPIPMTEVPPGSGVWQGEIPCAGNFDLAIQYKLTEGADSETFVVPIGGIALIDPAGVVFDQAAFDAARAGGQSEEQARNSTAIEGAAVRLQRRGSDGRFRNVLSGDPGISPHINPEVTGANGQYQWLTNAGVYRVEVRKDGYETATSREVTIPPEVTDLHVGLRRPGTTPPASPQPPAPAGTTPPPSTSSPKKAPCAGLKRAKLAACKRAQELKKAIASCKAKNKGKKKAKKRALCVKRAKALSKCSALTGKKNAKKKKRCTAAARRIGRPKGK